MPQPADRDLLMGVFALQTDFITRDALVDALNARSGAGDRPIEDVLVDRGALGPAERDALRTMLECRVAKHGGVGRSLAALSTADGVVADLRRTVADPDVHASLAVVGTTVGDDSFATRLPEVGDAAEADAGPAAARGGVRYRKLRGHARGGLGVVYVAHDQELNREVALKEIQDHHADHPTNRARFLLEAEVTGGLEHPGIVPVYGLGHYPDGRPFYAMRFIRGDSLKDAIAGFHRAETPGRDPGERDLSLQKLIRRFLDVCYAVDYAHSRGVLHRDLKPDNVMVGKYGETLVVDWGLAKSLGRSGGDGAEGGEASGIAPASGAGGTLPGSLIGTPGYMSPEQAGGRLDLLGPASDVYSLGATLYALLTDRPPFAGPDVSALLARVKAGDVARPRTVSPWLDPALEAVCLKAMALRPADRYETPRALAEDVERWLADEPTAAYREPFARRARRWARRHKTAVASITAATAVAAVLLGGVAAVLGVRTQRADAAATEALRRAEGRADGAGADADPAAWAAAVAEAQRAVDLLDSGAGTPALRDRARATRDGLARDRAMVDALDEARLRGADVAAAGLDTAAMHDAFLEAFRSYGIDVASLAPGEAAARVRSSRVREGLVSALDEWASLGSRNIPPDRLRAIAADADAVAGDRPIREAIARRDAEGLRRLVDVEGDPAASATMIRAVFRVLSKIDPAGSLPLLEAVRRGHPSDFWYNLDLALALAKATPPRFEESIRYYTAAVALRPESPGARVNLAVTLHRKGELAEAVVAYREAIRLKPDLAVAHNGLGAALRGLGDLPAALDAYREAIRLRPDDAEARSNLGAGLHARGDLAGAVAAHREAIRLKPDLEVAHLNLGIDLRATGDLAGAIAAFREAIRLKPDDPRPHLNLGLALADRGDAAGAAAAYRESIRLGPDALAFYNLGAVLGGTGADPQGAIAAFREAIRLKPGLAEAHSNLGFLLRAQGDPDGAAAASREAVRLKPDYAEAHCNLGLILKEQGRFAEALASFRLGHEAGSRRKNWRNPSAQWVAECERAVALEARLPAFLKGEARPRDAAESAELAELAAAKSLYATSARFWAEAFAADPALAVDLAAGRRYNAACSAARAGAGLGKDDPPPDAAALAALRTQARDWLRADLSAWADRPSTGPSEAPPPVARTLAHWKADPDLAGIRDAPSLAKLPAPERDALVKLWADVDALRARAER